MEDNDFAKRCSGNVSFPHMDRGSSRQNACEKTSRGGGRGSTVACDHAIWVTCDHVIGRV